MKALVLEKPGSVDGLKIVYDRAIPEPKEDEIRVKVHAAALNPSDYQVASHPDLPSDEKRVLGLDISGVVDAVGSKVLDFKVGDRVYYIRSITNTNGGFAEYACTPAHTVSKLPSSIPFTTAAAVPGAGFTAYQAIIDKLRPQKGKTILIHGGAGGVGSYAIQLAKMSGLTVLTTCLGKDFEYVKSLGADKAIDFQNEDAHKRVLELTNNRGVDYVLNTVGSEIATKDIDILAFGGELVVTAGFPDFNRLRFYEKGLSLHEIAFGAVFTEGDYYAQENISKIGYKFAQLIADSKISSPKITIIKLEDIPEYLYKLRDGQISGKVIAHIK